MQGEKELLKEKFLDFYYTVSIWDWILPSQLMLSTTELKCLI